MKRTFDIFGAAVGLLVASPVMAAITVLLAKRQGRPVLFCQLRTGREGKSFRIRKFRTMVNSYDQSGRLLPDDDRITALGRFLRNTSIDEVPELWNVLVGDMSLVGPRPLPVDYLPRFNPEETRRHEVRPGLTGWAQVNGRNSASWKDRLEMDVWYVDNRTFALDIRILCRTIGVVLRREGISAQGMATMPELRPHLADTIAAPTQ